MNRGRKFLSDLKLYSDYMGWNPELNRYETWEEAVHDVMNTHRVYYENYLPELEHYIKYAEDAYKEKLFLASQRNLQFRGNDIFKHHARLYNCTVAYCDKPSFFGNAIYLLLCGCGLGANFMLPFVNRLPHVIKRNKGTLSFIVEDSIEGWSNAVHVLISSYCYDLSVYEKYQGYNIKFDYSNIRPKGSKVGRRFKAPGPDGLKNSLEKIEELLNSYTEDYPKPIKSIIAYDIFMHISDAVLSGGVRRSACSIIVSPEDSELIYAKSGNWRQENPQRARSNNSVGLLRGTFSKEDFRKLLEINNGTSDIGFVFLNNIFEILNPCFEIGFTPLLFDYTDKNIIARIMDNDITILDEGVETAIQFCNLNEINGSACITKDDFFRACKAAAITGTLQAGYTHFEHLIDVLHATIHVTEYESLLGVSITGWMNQPWLFDPDVLRQGSEIVKNTNKEVANIIGINCAARCTTVKPSGNSAVILGCASGIHPEHSEKYFRVMQLNKDSETTSYLEKNMPYILEESVYSSNNTDYAVFVPIENSKNTLFKESCQGVKHLELIKLVKENWVDTGKRVDNCIIPSTSHNVSNTIIIDDYNAITDYIFEFQNSFTAVSFITAFGDKDYNQTPNTSVLSFDEIINKYGDGSLFASGLIVDGLHAFNDNLWDACQSVKDKNFNLTGDRYSVFYKKEWIRRAKKFSKNYFKNDHEKMIYCLKDVHLYHKWCSITRQFKDVDFTQILSKPVYTDIADYAAVACSGGECELF